MSKQKAASEKGKGTVSEKSSVIKGKIGRDGCNGKFIPSKDTEGKYSLVVESLSGPRGQCRLCGKKKGLCTCREE